MNTSSVNLLDLSDEVLLIILNKLNYLDVLYSLMGVDQKFDRLTRDITLTKSLDLTRKNSSNRDNYSKFTSLLDHFSIHILPEIQHNIDSLALDSWSINSQLGIGNYPQLHKLILVNINPRTAYEMFENDSSLIHMYKYQISQLVIIMDDVGRREFFSRLYACILVNVCLKFPSLTHFHSDMNEKYFHPRGSLDLSPIRGHSLKIVYLNIKLKSFDDCLFLLNDHLSQLRTLIAYVQVVRKTSAVMIRNVKIPSNLKCFSLTSYKISSGYDDFIVPCLQQMSQLEKLSLSLRIHCRTSFIDGNHLNNQIIRKMPYLQTFIFDIVTECIVMDEKDFISSDDIRRPLIENGYDVACYIDYYPVSSINQCHIYSLPFTMESMNTITNRFSFGGIFPYVRKLRVCERMSSIECEFFILISQTFPLLEDLTVICRDKQRNRFQGQQTSEIIEYSHLMKLNLDHADRDYAKQFLLDTNTCLPCLRTLLIEYETLVDITENFTNNTVRAKCKNLKEIIYSEEYQRRVVNNKIYTYFPLVHIESETRYWL